MRSIAVTFSALTVAATAHAQVATPRASLHVDPVHALAPLRVLGPSLEAHLAQLDHLITPGLRHAQLTLEHVAPMLDHIAPSLAQLGQLSLLGDLQLAGGFDELELPPESWAPQDPADSIWRGAREALNAGRESQAATLYRRIRTESRFSSSAYRAASYYWEAYARERVGSPSELRTALSVLDALKRDHPRYEAMAEADRLVAQINSALAQTGDAAAASRAAQQVSRATQAQCPDQDLRMTVIESLMHMPAENSLPILKNVMAKKDDCNAPLREHAMFIIAQSRSAEASALLLSAAKSDPSPKVRQAAVHWLSQVNSEAAVDAIAEIMASAGTNTELLESALFALSQQRSPKAKQMMRDLVTRSGTSKEARMHALFWLSQDADAETTKFLKDLYPTLTDSDLKQTLIHSLATRRGGGNDEFALDIAMNEREDMDVRKAALFQAGQNRSLSVARLGQLYATMPDREMRAQIIFTLSQRRESESLDKLIEIARTEKDLELRKQAIHWIGQFRDPRAARFLAEIIG